MFATESISAVQTSAGALWRGLTGIAAANASPNHPPIKRQTRRLQLMTWR